jgi:hypothetical protein
VPHGGAAVNLTAIAGSPASHERATQTRRIALIAAGGLERSQRAMQLLDTMLWVLKGTTNAAWNKARPEEADIVVVHQDEDAARTVAAWQARGKLVVQIASRAGDVPPGENTLVYPFRAVDVLALLERLGTQLDADLCSPATPARAPEPSATGELTWKFIETLRTVRDVRNSETWLAAHRGAKPVLWLRGDGAVYRASAPVVEALRNGSLVLSSLDIQPETAMPADLAQRSGFELAWYAGLQAGDALAPWLSRRTKYRLRQWPNFGSIRPEPAVLRIVSTLASTPASIDDIVARGGATALVAARAFNALSTCESIAEVETAPNVAVARAAAPSVATPAGGFGRFLHRVRKHLGLEVAS